MNNHRNIYGYPQFVRKDPDVYRLLEEANRTLGKAGFLLGVLAVGGCVLFKKVCDLSKEVGKLKETGK